MPAKTAVRTATVRDLPTLVHLWRELIGFDEALGGQDFRLARGTETAWERHLRDHLGKRERTALLGESQGQPVAFLLASVDRPPGIFMEREYGVISSVYVQEPYRGKGVGSALVEAALGWFEERRVGRVRVTTDTKNSLGVEFWKHRGFTATVVTMDRLL